MDAKTKAFYSLDTLTAISWVQEAHDSLSRQENRIHGEITSDVLDDVLR